MRHGLGRLERSLRRSLGRSWWGEMNPVEMSAGVGGETPV